MSIERTFSRAFLVCLGTFIAFCILEGGMRVYLSHFATEPQLLAYGDADQIYDKLGHFGRFKHHRYLGYVTRENYRYEKNRHNKLGFRGEELIQPKPKQKFRIIALGGSTTYSDGVNDYKESFPYLLDNYLHQKGLQQIEVVNAGVPGYSSLQSLINLHTRVLDLEPDLIVLCHGINDARLRLVWPPEKYTGDEIGSWDEYNHKTFLVEHSSLLRVALTKFGLLSRSRAAWRHTGLGWTWNELVRDYIHQKKTKTYPRGRFREISAEEIFQHNKNLYYEKNLKSLLTLARDREIPVVFVTFASSKQEYDGKNITAWSEFREAVAQNNLVMSRISQSDGAYLFDMTPLIEDSPKMYTDGVHFTKEGNRVKAHLIGDFLLANRANWGPAFQ